MKTRCKRIVAANESFDPAKHVILSGTPRRILLGYGGQMLRGVPLSMTALVFLTVLFCPLGSLAAIRMPHLISDHMVMQSGKEVSVWGWADPSEKVTVRVAEQTLIQTTWGGTSIQAWIPADGFTTDPNLKDDLDFINRSNAEYQQAIKAYHEKPASSDVKEPQHPLSHPGDWPSIPTLLYNAMIHPLAPYAIRGFLWYQGENNVFDTKPEIYSYKMKALIESWRKDWGQDDLPFYYVQLPPCNYKTTNSPFKLTRLWQAQTDVLGMVPNVGMAATSDVGDLNDIHPGKKDIVARRLAMIALHQAYGRPDIVSAAPRYLSHTIDGEKILVKFRDVGNGLVSSDGKPLTWFQIAGEDSQFVDAKAEIDGDTVVVSQIDIAKPAAVRFAWENIAQPNLASKEGLPAIPFSTVRW